MEKYKIEKDSVQATLLIPLFGRKVCTEKYPLLFSDKSASGLLNSIDYDFSALEKMSRKRKYMFSALETAMRHYDLVYEVKEYLKTHPFASIVNLGCGLDNTGRLCDNGKCKLYNIDFADVIKVRNALLPVGDRETNIVADIGDSDWYNLIDITNGAVFIAAGVFYYLTKEKALSVIGSMAQNFPNCSLIFDTANKLALKLMVKMIKHEKINDVSAQFHLNKAEKELSEYVPGAKISARGYMLGYHNLQGVGVSGLFRFLARVGDGVMKMRIVKVEF